MGLEDINIRRRQSQKKYDVVVVGQKAESINLALAKPKAIGEVDICFDSDLSRENMLSLSHRIRKQFSRGKHGRLAKDYTIELSTCGRTVYREEVRDNYLRHRVHRLPEPVRCDTVSIRVQANNASETADDISEARIFGVRLYEHLAGLGSA